jgi:uncharacterized coiled-coil DUF342 family protein
MLTISKVCCCETMMIEKLEERKDQLEKEFQEFIKKRDELNQIARESANKRDELNKEVKELASKVKELRSKRDELNKKVRELKAEKNELYKEIDKLYKELDELRKNIDKGGRPLGEIEKEIRRLEFRQQTTVMTIEKERALIERISKLKKELEERKAQLEKHEEFRKLISRIRELKDRVRVLASEIKAYSDEADKYHAEMTALVNQLDEKRKLADEMHAKFLESRKEADKCHEEALKRKRDIRDLEKVIKTLKSRQYKTNGMSNRARRIPTITTFAATESPSFAAISEAGTIYTFFAIFFKFPAISSSSGYLARPMVTEGGIIFLEFRTTLLFLPMYFAYLSASTGSSAKTMSAEPSGIKGDETSPILTWTSTLPPLWAIPCVSAVIAFKPAFIADLAIR